MTPTEKALAAQVAALKAQLDAAKAKNERKVTIKALRLDMTNKEGKPCNGNVAVYGMGRFPVTLYPNQWVKLLDMADDIRACIEANKDSLSFGKDD